ncbi:MAG: HNH endonuclease [Oscillospiraceae bacterium]|nr:HNH endonuclease [Oscillospiraceae bacterium]
MEKIYETPGKQIYASRKWQRYRLQLIHEANGICELCGKMCDSSYLRVHHKSELNEINISNPDIVYGRDNLQVICADCHNKVHDRFENYLEEKRQIKLERKVYIIAGAPMSGKTTYVQDAATGFDLIVDLDKIFQALSVNPLYDKPAELTAAVFAVRDTLYDMIRTRAGKHHDSYIISGRPIAELERLAKQMSAELVIIESSEEECLARLKSDTSGRDKDMWKKFISDWFNVNKNFICETNYALNPPPDREFAQSPEC